MIYKFCWAHSLDFPETIWRSSQWRSEKFSREELDDLTLTTNCISFQRPFGGTSLPYFWDLLVRIFKDDLDELPEVICEIFQRRSGGPSEDDLEDHQMQSWESSIDDVEDLLGTIWRISQRRSQNGPETIWLIFHRQYWRFDKSSLIYLRDFPVTFWRIFKD